jgi:hypothetical protein
MSLDIKWQLFFHGELELDSIFKQFVAVSSKLKDNRKISCCLVQKDPRVIAEVCWSLLHLDSIELMILIFLYREKVLLVSSEWPMETGTHCPRKIHILSPLKVLYQQKLTIRSSNGCLRQQTLANDFLVLQSCMSSSIQKTQTSFSPWQCPELTRGQRQEWVQRFFSLNINKINVSTDEWAFSEKQLKQGDNIGPSQFSNVQILN